MAKKLGKKDIAVNHIYENYDIYKVIYGREFEIKAWEVSKFAGMIKHWLGLIVKDRMPLHVLESFAGRSEHERFFADYPQLNIQSYSMLDIVPNDNPQVIVGDIRNVDLPKHINVVLAFYYSMHYVNNDQGQKTLGALLDMFRNVRSHLQEVANTTGKPACFIVHAGDHEQKGVEYEVPINPSIEGAQFPVPMHITSLFERFKADPVLDSLMIECDLNRVMDRDTGLTIDRIENAKFMLNGKSVGKLVVKEEFNYRVWAPITLIDIAREAGFQHHLSFRNVMENYSSDVELLDRFLEVDDDSDVEDYTITDILFYCIPESGKKTKGK